MKILYAYTNPIQLDFYKNNPQITKDMQFESQYKLPELNFADYAGIIFTLCTDQYLLLKLKSKLEDYLQKGGRIYFSGLIFKEFIQGLTNFEPIPNIKLPDFYLTQLAKHKIYQYIDIKVFNQRKGVSGFFGRGSNPPPVNAKPIIAIKNASVITDWELNFGKGKLYVHSGNDLWVCSERIEDNLLVLKNTLNWLGGEDEC